MSVNYDLSQDVTAYGRYTVKAQSIGTGYEDSDFAQLSYDIGATIAISGSKISIVSVIAGITGFGVNVDGTYVAGYSYDGSAGFEIDLDEIENIADGKHTVTLSALGAGIADNYSNAVTYFRGTAPIYGVSGLYSSSPALTRTDDAEELDYVINSSSGSIDSDFNNVFPWSEAEVVDDDAGKFLSMPEMYFRVGYDSQNRLTDVAVSSMPSGDGEWFRVPPFLYGCYGASVQSNKYVSKSGLNRSYNVTRQQARTYARNNGTDYCQLDLYHRTVMMFLWWIEFATKNSESVMTGNIGGSGTSQSWSRVYTGGTDNVETPSGFETVNAQMRYHYIEDFIGNLWEFVDGICCQASGAQDYVTTNPSNFSDDTTGKEQLSYSAVAGGYIKAYGWDSDNPFMCMPSEVGGSQTTYFCDYSEGRYASYPVLFCGANYNNNNANYGLSYCNYNNVGNNNNNLGARNLIMLEFLSVFSMAL